MFQLKSKMFAIILAVISFNSAVESRPAGSLLDTPLAISDKLTEASGSLTDVLRLDMVTDLAGGLLEQPLELLGGLTDGLQLDTVTDLAGGLLEQPLELLGGLTDGLQLDTLTDLAGGLLEKPLDLLGGLTDLTDGA